MRPSTLSSWPSSARRTSSGCWPTRASCDTAARSRPRSRTPGRRSPCARRRRCRSWSGPTAWMVPRRPPPPTGRRSRKGRRRSPRNCGVPVSASSGRRPSTRRCRPAASSTIISPPVPPALLQRRPVPVLDDRVRSVLARLEAEDADERARKVPREQRSRQVARTTGHFLFSFVAPQTDCEVLELGGSRGYSTIWLAAGVRQLGGRVLSLEHDPVKVEAWRRNVADAGLEDWTELLPGDALELLPGIDDVFDVVFLDAEKELYERLFEAARDKVDPGAVVIADNVLSHQDVLGAYSRARQADPTLESVTVPLDRGLEISVVLRNRYSAGYRGKEVVR